MDIINLDLVEQDLDLVDQSKENEVLDDFGFSEVYGYSYDEYEEEWN